MRLPGRLARFLAVGAAATLLDFGLLYDFVDLVGA